MEGKAASGAFKGSSVKDPNTLSIRRSCFRALSSYFKSTFAKYNRAWQDKRRNKKKTKDMNLLIDTYVTEEFGDLTRSLNPVIVDDLKAALTAVLHSHRYKKGKEDFMQDIDFSVIRDVLYSYTLDARKKFLNSPAYALLLHHFFVKGAYSFLTSKLQGKSNYYTCLKLEEELVTLHKEALITLNLKYGLS